MTPTHMQDTPEALGYVNVRVSTEILALMKAGDVEPVVILGVREEDDGTYDMTMKRPDVVTERDRAVEKLERVLDLLRAALTGHDPTQPYSFSRGESADIEMAIAVGEGRA